jgi:hypothetical protein
MIELAAAGLSIAAKLLFRFLDGPEKRLQRQKLEMEVEEIARRQQVTKISDDEIKAIRNRVVSELHLLVEQTPGLEWKPSKLGDKFTVERDADAVESSQEIMRRLRLAVDARRKLIEDSARLQAADAPKGWADAPAPPSPNDHEHDQPLQAGENWAQGESSVTDNAPDRLSRLARRIEERRR